MVDNTPSNNISTQNNDIDIISMFKHFVTGGNTPNDSQDAGKNIGIDDVRGSISVGITGLTTKNLIISLNIDPTSTVIAPTPNVTTPTTLLQESRCHAFYRIIGFPVVSTDKTYYNPGCPNNGIMQEDSTIDLTYKITVANGVGSAFEAISKAREDWTTNTSQIFSIPTSVEAGVLALTSGTSDGNRGYNIRAFSTFFTNAASNPFDFVVNDQQYSISSSQGSLVGDHLVLFTGYNDADGNNLLSDGQNINSFIKHFHIIAPFMVDPRIDFSIWAQESDTNKRLSKRIAIPFVPDSTLLKTSSTSYAQRPLLETIIRERINQIDTTGSAGQATVDAVNQIKAFEQIPVTNLGGNTTLSQIFSNNIFQTTQSDSFANYLNIIQSMMQKLVAAILKVSEVQAKYYWLPQPSLRGPENNGTIRDVINLVDSPELITTNDFDLIYNQIQSLLASITPAMAQATATPDIGGFSLTQNPTTFNKNTSDSFGDLSSQTNETINTIRNKALSDANDALQVIEMIMGEFSGLGLCDIIAIMGSLYVMDISDVLGFLDIDAYNRALAELEILPEKSDITTSMTNLASTVDQFYQIMDVIFLNSLNNAQTQ